MKTPTNARHTALALLGVFVALLVTVHGMPRAASGPSVAAPVLTTRPADPSASTTATFAFAAPSGAGFRCARDGSTSTTCTSPVTYSGLSQGRHTVSVTAVVAGTESIPTAYAWVVDTIAPPAPVLTSTPVNPTSTATNTATWTSAEAGVTFRCSLENGPWTVCTTPLTWVVNTSNNGQHQLAVQAVDAAGNVSATTAYAFKYEKGLPETGLPFTVAGSVGDLVPGVWRPLTVTVSNPNPVTIRVSALTVAVTADSTPPGCTSSANLELRQPSVTTSSVLLVPARGSVTLPAQGLATAEIRLRNLPTVNQDVCKGKSFALTWSGTASN
ncbi:hypothetical protein [Terracoccus sp. 273MFTsu3.1]|uniref:hypothetical protein n=1 Tax=Terracoccus sp. 273MFTsu3.1 TaxID=1172188 RepID=UPI00037379A7|nr:hypothetical protein [Terracoccus sp. 273MFTsu3.1]